MTTSGRARNSLFASLCRRVRAASTNLVRLVLAETNIDVDELSVLNWEALSVLDVQGCRRLTYLPPSASSLVSLNVSNCPRLASDSASIVLQRNAATISELRAKGLVGGWDESAFVADPLCLPALSLLDLTRRTFLARLLVHSTSLERLFLTNATHVGGLVVAPCLATLHCQGSELLARVLLVQHLVEPNPLALSQKIELEEKQEEQKDLKGSGSKLAHFLRQHSSASKLSFNKVSLSKRPFSFA